MIEIAAVGVEAVDRAVALHPGDGLGDPGRVFELGDLPAGRIFAGGRGRELAQHAVEPSEQRVRTGIVLKAPRGEALVGLRIVSEV